MEVWERGEEGTVDEGPRRLPEAPPPGKGDRYLGTDPSMG